MGDTICKQCRKTVVIIFSFYTIPYLIILSLLVGIFQKYFQVNIYYPYLMLSASVAFLYSEALGILRSQYVSEKYCT